jgi:TRAP-type C4-dicarboxylate transport system permease small subunit
VDAMLKRIHVVESWIAVLAFTIVVGIIMLDVIGRELVGPLLRQLGMDPGNTGIFSAQRVAIYALVVGTYTGIGIATATGSHIVPKIGDKMSPDSWGPAINRLADLTTALFLFGAAGYGWLFVNSARMLDMRAPILDWPLWMIQIFIPLGFVCGDTVPYFLHLASFKTAVKRTTGLIRDGNAWLGIGDLVRSIFTTTAISVAVFGNCLCAHGLGARSH